MRIDLQTGKIIKELDDFISDCVNAGGDAHDVMMLRKEAGCQDYYELFKKATRQE